MDAKQAIINRMQIYVFNYPKVVRYQCEHRSRGLLKTVLSLERINI